MDKSKFEALEAEVFGQRYEAGSGRCYVFPLTVEGELDAAESAISGDTMAVGFLERYIEHYCLYTDVQQELIKNSAKKQIKAIVIKSLKKWGFNEDEGVLICKVCKNDADSDLLKIMCQSARITIPRVLNALGLLENGDELVSFYKSAISARKKAKF